MCWPACRWPPLRRHAEQLVVGRLPDAERIREFRMSAASPRPRFRGRQSGRRGAARGLPDAAPGSPRRAPRLPRQRRLCAAATCGDRCGRPTTTGATTPTCIAACIRSASGPPMPTKARATRCVASSTPLPTREIVFTRGTTEAINLVAQSWGRAKSRPRRRNPDQPPRASLQHRALADAVRADRRRAEGHPDQPSAAS